MSDADNTEKVIRHLEMIQGVINRLADNSFKLKGWSIALVSAVIIFIAKEDINSSIMLLFILSVIGFWILDGYFILQERLFRDLYNTQRVMSDTDFIMNTKEFNKGNNTWFHSTCSITLSLFYCIELVILFILWRLSR